MATKPNLSQYFFFLVKSQDRLDKKTANEAQGFWDSLCEIYNLTGPLPEIVNSLEELVSDDLTGTPLQYFGSKDNADGSVNALQLFSNGVLIFLITISKPPSYVTDTPEADWEQQLEIQVTARDLKNVLGTASLLHTKSEQFQNLLMTVRTKIPFAKGQNIHYCTFDFGRFIRFGDGSNYLLVINPEMDNTDRVTKFISNDLPYILTLNFVMTENYNSILDLQKQLEELDNQVEKHNQELPSLKFETDHIMLAIRKDHVSEINTDVINIKSKITKYADHFNESLIKLNALINHIKVIRDDVFNDYIQLFNGYKEEIQKWLTVSEELYNNISSGVKNYSDELSNLIMSLDTKAEKSRSRRDIYTPSPTTSEILSIDNSPYKRIIDEYSASSSINTKSMEAIPLEWCTSYVLNAPKPARSIKTFNKLLAGGFPGLCITQKDREIFIDQLDLEESSIYQINVDYGEYYVPPVLSKVSHIINEFLSDNVHGIIYIDCVNKLIEFNDFNRVLEFVNNIKESVVLNDAILIISSGAGEAFLTDEKLKLVVENSLDITELDVVLDDLY